MTWLATWVAGALIRRGMHGEEAQRLGRWAAIAAAVLLALIALAIALAATIGFTRYVVGLRDQTVQQKAALQEKDAQIAASKANDDINSNQAVAIAVTAAQSVVEQKEQDDASQKAPAGSTGAATRAANCVRWRQQHPDRVLPAACHGA
ncbi:hypothetical protein [Sphingomonas oryzagri]|uniref:Uncharacterized protein n=1 Tax=Sphingomonas oryzagri TaxID=3042314 RepID=A0ABT6N5S4_9SPHN|nr:hypothetical protein [Sphingomonas oryzagri]MDH7640455.1 hypothetical protein [Sphingomonas oryzagri]